MNLEEIERGDLLKFSAFLRDEKKQSPRSVYNKFANVMAFLKAQGIRGLVDKNDWPRLVQEEPEILCTRRAKQDAPAVGAMLDRLLHHGHVLKWQQHPALFSSQRTRTLPGFGIVLQRTNGALRRTR
jgi:hypothetical protein